MTSFRQFGEDFGTWYQLDEVGDLAVSVWGQGTAYLTRAEVTELRDHLNDVLAADTDNAEETGRMAEPLNDIEATGRCCCAGCIGIGPCDLDLGRGDTVSTCAWCWDHDCCCDDVEDQYDLPGDQDWPTVTPVHHLHQETT